MKKILASLLLIFNFTKAALLSGWDTARIILVPPKKLNSGMTNMSYGELCEPTISVLSAMITLTPGTTLIDIDCQRGEFVLHMLDLDKREETMAIILHDFATPLKILCEDTL